MERFETKVKKAFGAALKKARKREFRHASTFADAIRVERHTYRTWERGEHLPDLWTVVRMCRILKIEPNTLLPLAVTDEAKSDPNRDRIAS
jgi:DNA-binding XRE family transcriptional regulator